MPASTGFLNAADWLVIIAYLAGMIGLGISFGRDQRNTRDYFLGSRSVPWWGIGFSIVAAETSALTVIGVPAMAYGGNLMFIQMIVGYVIARIILAIWLVPHYFRGEIYSPYQLFGDAFGPGARQMAGGLFLLSETLAAGVRVHVACIPVQLMLGVQVLPAIILFVALSLIYTYIGGVKAVIWTDAVQFGLFLAGGLFAVFYIPSLVEGGFSAVFQEASAAGKLAWLTTHLDLVESRGIKGFAQAVLAAPFNIWMGIVGGTIQVMSSHGAEQLIVQRVLACRNVADGRKALALSAVLIFPLFLIFLVAGAMLWVYYQHHAIAIPIPEVKEGSGIKANDFIFPIFMITAVPHWLKGFLIVAILSAAMSSVSSALTSLSSVSTMDFLRHAWKGRSEGFYLDFSKYSTVGWAALLVVVAYLSREVAFVLNAAFALRGLTSGALLGGLLLAVFWRGFSARSLVTGMGLSVILMISIQILPRMDWSQAWWQETFGAQVFWPWYTLIGTVTTFTATWLADRLLFRKAPGT
jgi:SSS family solute:Na+ symporter